MTLRRSIAVGLFTGRNGVSPSARSSAAQQEGDRPGRHLLPPLVWRRSELSSPRRASPIRPAGAYRDAWDHAALRTPHGQPIELTEGDFW